MRSAIIALTVLTAGASGQNKPIFTEDFESGQLNRQVWEKRVQGTATIDLQEGEAAHGKFALHVHYPEMAQRSFALLLAQHLPAELKGHLFGRAYVKIAPKLPEMHTVLFLAGSGGWPSAKYFEIGGAHGVFQPSYQDTKSPRGEGRGEGWRRGDNLPLGKWVLLEWELNDNPSTITMWLDRQSSPVTENGQKVQMSSFKWPKDSGTNSNLVGGFEEFGIGVRVFGDVPQAFDVYYDDIAIDTKRVGPVR